MSTTVKVSNNSQAAQQQYAEAAVEDKTSTQITDIPAPFTEYRNETKIPYTAKYLDLENVWDEDDIGDDVMKIENYMEDQIKSGEIENDVKIVEKKLKAIEKMAGIDKLESRGLRLQKLAAFIEYLRDLDRRISVTNR